MDLFELEAILRLNTTDFDKGVEDAEKSGTGLVDRIANTWTRAKSKFQTVSTILKPVTDLVEDVVDKYSNYQQLIGGVEKLFESSAKTVATNARNAFRTAGMSMNSYMDMAVSMSASLIQSLAGDTEAAADLVDVAIQDMSDNVNTFGRSMDDVQNAYRGLARGNYTMLDNLSLGYQGSAQEMLRLMQDAAALNEEFANSAVFGLDEKGHLNASYADMIRAIHIIQENMGVTGTTQREAAGTVSGSNASMKAALENLKTLMGDPKATQEEIEQATKDFTVTLESWLKNITPIITTAVKALFNVIGSLLDNLFKEIGVETDFKGFFKAIAEAVMNLLPIIAEGVKFLAEKAGHVFEFGSKVGQVFQAAFGIDPGGNDDLFSAPDEEGREWFINGAGSPAEFGDSRSNEKSRHAYKKNGYFYMVDGYGNIIGEYDDWNDFNSQVTSHERNYWQTKSGTELPWNQVEFERNGQKGRYVVPTGDTGVGWENAISMIEKVLGRSLEIDEISRLINSGTKLNDKIDNAQMDVDAATVDGNVVTVNGASWDLSSLIAGLSEPTPHAKGLWDVPYDDYYARLHRGEMVLTASEARDYREGNGGGSDAVVAAIQRLSNELQNLKIVVGQKVFGQTVVDYGGKRMNNYIGKAEDKVVAGYGWG